MSSANNSKGVPYILKLVIGLVLMFGGMYLSVQKPEFMSFQESLEKSGIPLDLGKTVAIIGVFLILTPLLDLFFFKPLQESITNRTTELEGTFTEAENLRSEMTRMKTEYEDRLARTEAEAREQIQSQIKEAQDLKKQLMADAQAKADQLRKEAEVEIANQKKQALTELRVHVATLSLQATEKILQANVDTDRNRKLIDDFLTTVEAKN
ncbi:MAG: F0F1 ATP synthase subunit B [Armatimonadetes bacterium]|nr:F0F1 ATP synthase subunit B [Armatimonadota bacterium]